MEALCRFKSLSLRCLAGLVWDCRTIGGVDQWVADVESTYRRVHRRMLRKKISKKMVD